MLKKYLINFFLACWLLVMLIDATPLLTLRHGKLKNALDPYLDVTGLWQGGWQLFAPTPDMINASISAELAFSDGSKVVVDTPKWRELSAWKRFTLFREAEFIDSARLDGNSCVWPGYCEYLRRTIKHPTNPESKATEVLLIRNWVDIAPPNSFTVTQFPEPPEQTNRFIMFAEMYSDEE